MSTPNVRDVQKISRVLKIVLQLPVFRWGSMAMSENAGQRISRGHNRKKACAGSTILERYVRVAYGERCCDVPRAIYNSRIHYICAEYFGGPFQPVGMSRCVQIKERV